MKNQSDPTGQYKKNRSRLKFHSGIAVLIFVFVVVLVYAAGVIGKSFNKTQIPVISVKYDVISVSKAFDGAVIRDEIVYASPSGGTLEFLVNENEKIKKDAAVLRLKDAGADPVEADLESLNRDLFDMQKKRGPISLFSPDVERINRQIKTLVDKNIYKLINADAADIYALKESIENEMNLRNQIMLSENKGAASPLLNKKENYEAELSKYVTDVRAPVGGVISFYTDGLEGEYTFVEKENLTREQIKAAPPGSFGYGGKIVKEGDAAFKIVTSNEWYIAAYIENESADGIRPNEAKTIYVETDAGYANLETVVYSVAKGEKESYVLFKMTKYMLDYIDARNVRFKLNDSVHRGLKIPATAIVDRTFLKIPVEYIGEGNRVTKSGEERDETVSVSPFRNGTDADEGYVYVSLDVGRLNLGDTITAPGCPPYVIAKTASVKGIYTANDGVARFREIHEDFPVAAGGYCLLDPVKNPGVRTYDRVVIDASNVTDNQIVN